MKPANRAQILCFECGSVFDHWHHVVPKSLGGTKTIPLCESCHSKVHNVQFLNHKDLTRKGIERARQNGVRFGNDITYTIDHPAVRFIMNHVDAGNSFHSAARELSKNGIPTANSNSKWFASTVSAIYSRYADFCFEPDPKEPAE